MTVKRRWRRPLGLLFLVLVATVQAQAQSDSFGDLSKALKVGKTAVVTATNGQKTKGKVVEALASSLVIDTSRGRQTFVPADVEKIGRAGPIWDGAIKGFAVGAAIVATDAVIYPNSCSGCYAEELALIGGIGAGIGLGIDAAFGPKTVFKSTQKRTVVLAPLLGKERRGVAAMVRF